MRLSSTSGRESSQPGAAASSRPQEGTSRLLFLPSSTLSRCGIPGPLSLKGLGQPFELARTHLVMGTIRRRSRQKRAARDSLQAALNSFEQMGARLWAERARAELARIGGRALAADALTPTEQRVAELVAAGGTYREVADALFISPKTVQWNLSKIYRKLGIRSRSQLAASLPPAHGDESTPAKPPVAP